MPSNTPIQPTQAQLNAWYLQEAQKRGSPNLMQYAQVT